MDTTQTRSSKWATWLVVLLAAVITIIGAGWIGTRYELGPVDDAYISLRYAANWADGRGMCFNTGERVEGYTNFLLVALEAAAIRCGVDHVTAMLLIGRLSLAAVAGLVAAFTFWHVLTGRKAAAIAAGVLVGLNPVLVCWAFSGMESCLYAALLVAGLLAVLAARTAIGAIAAAVLMILAALTRPEAVVLFPVAVLVLYAGCKSWRIAGLYASVLLVGFGAYFVTRAIYFGYLFPNTFYAKLDYGNAALAQRGALYVWDFVWAALPLFVLAVAALVLLRKSPLWARACLLIAVVQLAVTIYVGGDHFAMFRFMVPVVPFLTLAGLYPAAAIVRGSGARAAPRWIAILASFAVIGVADVLVAQPNKRGELEPIKQLARFSAECEFARQWSLVGMWFRMYAPADATLTTVVIGAMGYFSDLTIIDPHGLVDVGIAHGKQELGRGYAGHEKYNVQEVLRRRPSYIMVVHILTPAPVSAEELADVAWGDFNQGVLRDPEVPQTYRYENVPLGNAFMNLLVRRDMPAFRSRGQ